MNIKKTVWTLVTVASLGTLSGSALADAPADGNFGGAWGASVAEGQSLSLPPGITPTDAKSHHVLIIFGIAHGGSYKASEVVQAPWPTAWGGGKGEVKEIFFTTPFVCKVGNGTLPDPDPGVHKFCAARLMN